MRGARFSIGLVVGAIAGAASVLYIAGNHKDNSNEIIFASKNFYNSESFVGISGTMKGNPIAYPNNTYSIGCYKDRSECWIANVEQIGTNQIGRMDAPYEIEIKKWTSGEVVAMEEGIIGCKKITLTIDRQSKEALWVEEPINQTEPMCKGADTNIRKYSFGNSPGWMKLFGKK